MTGKKFRVGVLAGCSLIAASATKQASAATIYSTGFETSSGFTLNGNLVPNGTPYPFATQTTVSSGTLTGTVGGSAGNQNALLTATNIGAYPSESYFYPTIPNGTVNTTTTPIIDVAYTLSMVSTAGTAGFGITIFNASTPTATPILQVFEDSSDHIVVYDKGSSTPFITTTGTVSSNAASPDVFNVELNYGTATFGVTENGSLIASGSFDQTGGFKTAALTGVSFDDTVPTSGTGTFDNFSISASVPEPATGSVILGGLALAGLRRRRQPR